jgi:replicative DNA helicase
MLFDGQASQKCIVELRNEDFANEMYKLLFSVMKKLFADGKGIDLVNLCAELSKQGLAEKVGGIEAIMDIVREISTTAYIGNYIESLIQLRHRRESVEFAKKIYEAAHTESEITDVYNAVANIPDFSSEEKEESTKQIMSNALSRIAERYKNEEKRIPGNETGFTDLDRLTGGIKDGELILLSAEPNVGKSILAHQIGIYFATRNMNAEYFNFEMNNQQIGDRTLAIALPFEVQKIKYPKDHLTDNDLKFIGGSRIDEVLDKHLHIYSKMRSKTIAMIRAKCKESIIKHGPINLIVVDYLQLMDGEGEDRERIEANCRGLKNLAGEFSCPVIAISSLSRNGELRGSGQLDFDADQKWHMTRSHDDQDAVKRSQTEVIIKKNRDGGKGIVNLTFQEKYVKFFGTTRM